MAPRILAAAAAVWSALYGLLYLVIINAQGQSIALLYVLTVLLVTVFSALAALEKLPRAGLITALVFAALAAVPALLSIGILLIPVIGMLAIALILTLRPPPPPEQTPPRRP